MTRRALALAALVAAATAPAQPAGGPELDAVYRRAAELSAAGKHAEALPEYERVLALTRAAHGPDHREVGVAAGNVGGTRYKLGDLPRAEADLAEAVRILGGVPGQEGEAATQVRLLLGTVRIGLKKYPDAERDITAGLRSLEALRVADHPDLAVALGRLGEAAAGQEKWQAAEAHHRRALAVRERAFKPDALPIADSLDALGWVCLETKQWDAARDHYRRAAKIREGHEDFPLARMDPERFRRYMATAMAAGGDGPAIGINPSTWKLMSEWQWLSVLAERSGQVREAAGWADRGRRLHRGLVTFLVWQETDLRSGGGDDTWAADRMGLALKAPADPEVAAVTASWAVNAKGILAEILTEKLRAAKGDPKLTTALADLDAVRRDIAAATLARPAPADEAAHAGRLARLNDRRRELEAASVSATVQLQTAATDWVDTAAVRKALPADTVYLDLARVGREGKQRYAAWVVPPAGNGDVRAFDLGDADTLDALAEAARGAIQDAPREVARVGEAAAVQKLDKLLGAAARRILRPVYAAAGGYPNWVVSPDADLWMLPWAALPAGDGTFLAERHVLRFVVSGRELAPPPPPPGVPKPLPPSSPLVLADPDYDAPGGLAPPVGAAAIGAAGGEATRAAGRSFARLAGTAAEAAAVRPKLAAWAKADPRVLLAGDATEGAFKAAARPRAVVLSTHGYYLAKAPSATGPGTRGLVRVDDGPVTTAPGGADALPAGGAPQPDDPLLRCGLALAGANRRGLVPGGHDDGVLTGYEIVATDLRGTELVVLSACETGLGATAAGRGVVGLRQAFHLAGAGAVVASLWQVPDAETAELMTGLFDQMAGGASPSAALAAAQRGLIRRRTAARGAAHPFYWAAFSVSGGGR